MQFQEARKEKTREPDIQNELEGNGFPAWNMIDEMNKMTDKMKLNRNNQQLKKKKNRLYLCE